MKITLHRFDARSIWKHNAQNISALNWFCLVAIHELASDYVFITGHYYNSTAFYRIITLAVRTKACAAQKAAQVSLTVVIKKLARRKKYIYGANILFMPH